MYKFIVSLGLTFCCLTAHCQFLPGVKHIEIVSEVQDSMVLLNKPDIDKINKTYFEKRKLDSLNVYNNKHVELLEDKIEIKDSIIINQELMLQNNMEINSILRKEIEDNIIQYEKQLKKEGFKKVG